MAEFVIKKRMKRTTSIVRYDFKLDLIASCLNLEKLCTHALCYRDHLILLYLSSIITSLFWLCFIASVSILVYMFYDLCYENSFHIHIISF